MSRVYVVRYPNIRGELSFKFRTYANFVLNRIKHGSVVPPFDCLDVNPEEISTIVATLDNIERLRIEDGLCQVKTGDWDMGSNITPFEEHTIYRGLYQRFDEGKEWENTTRFEYAKKQLEEHGSFNNYTTIEEFRSVRCEFIDELYESIRSSGYRSNKSDKHAVPSIDIRNNKYRFFHKLEPLVAIDRSGKYHWVDGFHRVTIAKLLGIDSIPVNVLCQHTESI